jgi:ABC-type multidrug transport system ATPase subunit
VPALDVSDVSKCWPPRRLLFARAPVSPPVLSRVSFAAARGEIVALLGSNGAGKTTLLKIIAGLIRPDAGSVRVNGSAYAGGERGFYFRLTLRENLAFFAALDGHGARARADRIAAVARSVDLTADLDRRFADASSGIRQRLAVARALITDPAVLLLDEPTRALDPPHAARLRHVIRETLAGRDGKTVIVATNLIDEALELGGRIALLRDGALTFVDRSDGTIRAQFGMTADA